MGDSQPRRLEEILARELLLVAGAVLVALAQATLLITPLGFPPPILLVLVICRALVAVGSAFPDSGLLAALRWSLYGGLALDLFSSLPLGSHSLALTVAIGLVALATRSLRPEGLVMPIVAVLAAATVYELILGLISQGGPGQIAWRSYATVIMLPSILVALIPTPPIYAAMRRLLRGDS